MACVVKRRGKWVVDFRDQHGKRRWETYKTRKQADDALATRIGQVKGGAYRSAADLPTASVRRCVRRPGSTTARRFSPPSSSATLACLVDAEPIRP